MLNSSYVKFTGLTGTEMKYSYTNNRWQIVESFSKETLAFMIGTKLPFGINKWYFPQSKCSDAGSEYRTLNFHKYVEQPGNYCCNDGNCFTSEFVCDGVRHCASGEDELNCHMIDLPNNYDKMIPPAKVSVDFNIENILGINDYESTFDVYFTVNITWFDNKLSFHYLKNNQDENIVPNVERSSIWVPNVHFAFVRNSFNLNYDEGKMFVEKKSQAVISGDRSELNTSEVYRGHSNPITLFSEHYMRFFCEFDGIAEYPFGSEICIDFYLDGRANSLTKINSSLKHPTRKLIGQYEIKGWDMKHHLTDSKDVIRISISLTKRPLSIFMMTYLPTLLMNIINQATNYISGDSKYDLIIEVNITSMVVLATIYITVSTYLPSTANIKPVEYWLLFSLAYPFLVIITNVILQVSIKKKK